MNNLNSVLIEGVVTGKRIGVFGVQLDLESHRESEPAETSRFFVNVPPNTRLAEVVEEMLEVGRGVRVVGRLSGSAGNVVIVTEHIEFKPIHKKATA
jgi:hypothetical protein